jgi:predicted nucleic acid-binding protein
MGVIVLDSNVIIDLIAGRTAEAIPSQPIAISIITEIELRCVNRAPAIQQDPIAAFLMHAAVIGLTHDIKERTILLRRTNQLKLPDAIIAATALTVGATLLTNDARLLKVPGLAARAVALVKP